MRFWCSVLVGLFLLGVAGEASAEKLTREQVAEARRHYKAAITAAKQQDFDTAVTEYKAAFHITKDAKLHYQIATTLEKAGHFEEAVAAYKVYMDTAKLSPAAQQRIGDKVYELNEQLAAAVETAESATGTAENKDGAGDAGSSGSLSDTELGKLDFESSPAEAPPPFLETQHGWQRTAGWITLGVAAAFGTTAGALAASARSRQGDLSRLTGARNPPGTYQGSVRTRYEDAVSEGEMFDRWAVRAAIGAGATAAIAITFFLLDNPVPVNRHDQVVVTPTLLDDTVGISASWGF